MRTPDDTADPAPRDTGVRAPFEVFWAAYLLHHAHPLTRRLHFVGTLIVWVGFGVGLATSSFIAPVLALLMGYACAFTGHWRVERNEPLTLKSPIRAGLCNLRLFALECLAIIKVGGGYRGAVSRALAVVPLAVAQACCEVPDNQ